ncbi:MAG: LysR family transcriptional regulator [bacterium]|nr:MAG: LysR family transcriptional regulator [bacterium]
MLDFKYKVFLSAGKLLSFSKAAKEISLTQPAVSFQIRHLEEEVGARLFVRYPNKIELTPIGSLLLKELVRLQAESTKVQERIMSKLDRLWGTISVGASTTVGNYFLPPVLANYKSKYKDVSIRVVVDNTDEILSDLADGIVDFAIVEGPIKTKQWQVEKAFIDELVVIAPRNFPGLEKGVITKKQLAAQPFITRETGSGTRDVIESLKDESHHLVRQSKIILELGSTTAIKRAVEAGLGVSIVSLMTVRKEKELGTLWVLRIPEFHIYRTISFIFPKGIGQTAMVNEMVKLCRESGKKVTPKDSGTEKNKKS